MQSSTPPASPSSIGNNGGQPGRSRLRFANPFRELLAVRARYKGYYGGRSSGKTHQFAGALVLLAARNKSVVLCCREILKSIADSSKQILENKIGDYGLRSRFYLTQNEILCDNGSRFIFRGLRDTKGSIRSIEGVDIVWVDEAQYVSAQSLDELKNSIRKPGSEIWFSWNPINEKDPVERLLRTDVEEPDPNLLRDYDCWQVVRQVNYDQNPFVPDVAVAEMQRDLRRDPGMFRHVWLGEYLRFSDAQVFHNWRTGKREEFQGWSVGNPAADVSKHAERYYLGADFGFSTDPTVLIRCWIYESKRENRRELWIDKESVHYKLEIDKIPATWKKDIPLSERWPIVADSSRPDTIAYLKRNGYYRLQPARKGAHSIEDGVEFLKTYDIIVHPDCINTIQELTRYSWKVDPQTQQVLPILEDKENHVIDSLRYALESTRVVGYSMGFVRE